MTAVVSYEEAKIKQVVRDHPGPGQSRFKTPFFGSSSRPEFAHASLNQHDADGSEIGVHYHFQNQFQVVIEGKGKIGRHSLVPYSIHFTRAGTPYGPIGIDAQAGLTFFVLRAHWDVGPQHLPQKLDQLKRVPDRRPWQISSNATFPVLQEGAGSADILLQPVPGIKDEDGLAAYALTMTAGATAFAPDPSTSDGQYLIVSAGSLLHDGKERSARSLVFVEPEDGPFQLKAGPQGLQAIVLNFPRPTVLAHRPVAAAAPGLKTWQCTLCGFVYDEALGLPEDGIAPGTRWTNVPDAWSCPDCSAGKSDFQMREV